MNFQDSILAVITGCPVRQHPNTFGLDAAYSSIRNHLPQSEILILQDGIRFETECLHPRYDEYKNRIQQRIESGQWTNIRLRDFEVHKHQAGMMRAAFREDLISCPLILFIEPDLQLSTDFIDWDGLTKTLLDGEVAYVHFDDGAEFGKPIFHSKYEVPLTQTTGFTTTPFIARTDFIQRILSVYKEARTFLESDQVNYLIRRENIPLATYLPQGCTKRWLGGGVNRASVNGWNGPHFPTVF